MQPSARGLIQVYTGNGKGKTTAALGLALRAVAAGKRVAIVFFDKGGSHYSERRILGSLGVDWFGYGMDRIDPKTNRFRFGVLPEDVAQADAGIAKALELTRMRHPEGAHSTRLRVHSATEGSPTSPYYDLLILDEINTAVALGMVSEQSVERLMDVKPDALELVLTGRTDVAYGKVIRPSYFNRADLITDMRLEEHYFYHGVAAREGIDF